MRCWLARPASVSRARSASSVASHGSWSSDCRDSPVAAHHPQAAQLALAAPPVVDQLVPGDPDQPAGARGGARAATDGVDGGQERLGGQVLGQCRAAAACQQVAVDLVEGLVVEREQPVARVGRAAGLHILIVVRGRRTPTPPSAPGRRHPGCAEVSPAMAGDPPEQWRQGADGLRELAQLPAHQGLPAVAQCGGGLGVHVDQQPVRPGRGGGQRHRRDQVRPAGGVAGVDDHRQMAEPLDRPGRR